MLREKEGYLTLGRSGKRMRKIINTQVDELTAEIKGDLDILKESHVQLQQSHRELNQEHQDFIDSLFYAGVIQSAIMPKKRHLDRAFENVAVLYMPKHIVSGDFYWYYSGDEYDYVCAADCTGHGVPGAFMSILGVDILEKIVHRGVIEPEHILDELSMEIHNLLRRNNSEVKDGMDLTIVAIKKDKSIAKVAGVQNPVYLVRDGEVIQYKTDRIEIGVVGETKHSAQTVELKPGDVFYQFTDGFADQRGGPKNKKFFYPPFRKLLLEISDEDFEKQEQILKENFAAWKGSNEQYDDVCIVGYQV